VRWSKLFSSIWPLPPHSRESTSGPASSYVEPPVAHGADRLTRSCPMRKPSGRCPNGLFGDDPAVSYHSPRSQARRNSRLSFLRS